MSDYWKSNKKYFCTYCKIYIADDKPSRSQHENGLKHKGNVDRYVREVYKKGETNKKDKADEAAELARVNNAAALASGHAPTPSAKPTTTKKPSAPSDPYANYSTAASLGFVDDSAAAFIKEQEARQQEVRLGSWTAVPSSARPVPSTSTEPAFETRKERPAGKTLGEKVLAVDEELYDPIASIKLKPKGKGKAKEEVKEEGEPKVKGFRKAEFGVYVKEEEFDYIDEEQVKDEEDVKPDIAPAPSLFKKKRKPKDQGNQPAKKEKT